MTVATDVSRGSWLKSMIYDRIFFIMIEKLPAEGSLASELALGRTGDGFLHHLQLDKTSVTRSATAVILKGFDFQ